MTHQLANALVNGSKPFDQNMLWTPHACNPDELLELNRQTLAILSSHAGPWFYHDDWLLHDGFISEGSVVSPQDVTNWMTSVKTMPWFEELVYAAVYPSSMEWLWRWILDEESQTICSFDLTASDEILNELASRLDQELLAKTAISSSSKLFSAADLMLEG